jgi:hypothetical protein
MPPQHRLGLHDNQGSTPLAPSLGEQNPEVGHSGGAALPTLADTTWRLFR